MLTLQIATWADSSHNSALEWFVSLGVLGLLVFSGAVVLGLVRSP